MKAEQQESGEQSARQEDNRPRLLVIDDSRMVRVSIRKVLQHEFSIIEAGDGEEGWEKLLQDDTIQVVITDAGMPRLDGYQLIERIRASEIGRINAVPIMMVTGAEVENVDLKEKALALGATDFITKPFDKTQLLARARAHAKFDQTNRTLEKTEDALEEQSAFDPVTKVHNRRYFLLRGEKDLSFAMRHNHDLSLFCITLDKYEVIKQNYDTKTKDSVLAWLAEHIKHSMRKEDTVARISESTFSVLAPTAGRMEAAVLCERIRNQIESTPYSKTVIALPVSVSVGLVNINRDRVESFEKFLSIAEERVKEAMDAGGNRVVATSRKKIAEPVAPRKKQILSIDSVLKVFNGGNTDLLIPYLKDIASSIVPLLEFCNKKLNWDLQTEIEAIKKKLQ